MGSHAPPPPEPLLEDVQFNGSSDLGLCQGDCDDDDECAEGLMCFKRSGYDDVLGCRGSGTKNWDYCTPIPSADAPPVVNVRFNSNVNLGMCEGDCDGDSECAVGLVCYQRDGPDGASRVPGCSGAATDDWDYCIPGVSTSTSPLVEVALNGASNLGVCQGDCDSDRECARGLICYPRDGVVAIPGCQGAGMADWDCECRHCASPSTTTHPSPPAAPSSTPRSLRVLRQTASTTEWCRAAGSRPASGVFGRSGRCCSWCASAATQCDIGSACGKPSPGETPAPPRPHTH